MWQTALEGTAIGNTLIAKGQEEQGRAIKLASDRLKKEALDTPIFIGEGLFTCCHEGSSIREMCTLTQGEKYV